MSLKIDDETKRMISDVVGDYLASVVTTDYSEQILDRIFDDVIEDLEATVDEKLYEEGYYCYTDIQYSIGRVLIRRLGGVV